VNYANPLSEIGRAAVESAARAAKISMDSAERTLNVRAAAGAKDVQELLAVRARIAENTLENLMGYSRSLYEVASEAQAEYSRLADERMARFQQAVTEGVEQAARSAPGGSDVAVTAIKSQLAATTAAFDTFTKAARSFASYADAGVTAPRQAKRK